MRLLVLYIVILLFAGSLPVSAQVDSDDFNVRQTIVGIDSNPPTIPTLLSADPVSSSQIDLAWTASVDDFTLWGYVVFRDSDPVATTTLTTYADTGLTASTTYAYFIQAFDAASNNSASSNSLSTTTLEAPVVIATTSSSSSGSTAARVVVEEVVVTPGSQSAQVDVTSSFPARFEIRWGRTGDFELGQIASDILKRNYSTMITGLEPATKYQYQIIGYTPTGISSVIETGQFHTLGEFDLTAPANVNKFTATPESNDVLLSWELPQDDTFSYVRIVRSHLGYPMNPNDGAIVYQGDGKSAIDLGVLSSYSPVYYTAFVYDTFGNVSSGAITLAYVQTGMSNDRAIETNDPVEIDNSLDVGLEELATTTQKMPGIFDVLIKQDGADFSFGEKKIVLDSREPFLLQLDVGNVTTNLKSIIVTLQDPTDNRQTFSFLLRLNEEQTAYEATIAPLGVEGESGIVLSIYDFRSLRVAEYRTRILFEQNIEEATAADLHADDTKLFWQFLASFLVLGSLFIWWLIAKKRDEDKEAEAGA